LAEKGKKLLISTLIFPENTKSRIDYGNPGIVPKTRSSPGTDPKTKSSPGTIPGTRSKIRNG